MPKKFWGSAGLTANGDYIVEIWNDIESYEAKDPPIGSVKVLAVTENHRATEDLIASRIAWLLRRDSTNT